MNNKKDKRMKGIKMFSDEDAIKYGVEEATILWNIKYWVQFNKDNNTNFHDGYYWTYNSATAFELQFPFWNGQKIRRLLLNLEEAGIIKSGNYNKKGYDRTKWYTTTDIEGAEAPVETIETELNIDDMIGNVKKRKEKIDKDPLEGKNYTVYTNEESDVEETTPQAAAYVNDTINNIENTDGVKNVLDNMIINDYLKSEDDFYSYCATKHYLGRKTAMETYFHILNDLGYNIKELNDKYKIDSYDIRAMVDRNTITNQSIKPMDVLKYLYTAITNDTDLNPRLFIDTIIKYRRELRVNKHKVSV